MRFIAESVIRTTPENLFAFHEIPGVLEQLTPAWAHARLIESPSSLRPGSRAIVDVRVVPLVWVRMESVHTVYRPPFFFEDEQVEGVFRSWRHRHSIAAHEQGARLTDTIEFDPPMGFLGRWLAPLFILPRLRRLFAYRHEVTRAWCERRSRQTDNSLEQT